MAKKSKRKATKKPARKSTKKAPTKAARGKPAKAPTAPRSVSTGKGASAESIGRAVVDGFNRGTKDHELWNAHWSPKAESIEGSARMAWAGRKAMDEKAAWWNSSHTMHGASAEGPYIGATGFAVKFRVDVTDNSSGKRMLMEEVGVYTVQNGKIIREEFMGGSMQVVSAPTDASVGG
jgi:hypothetical protein